MPLKLSLKPGEKFVLNGAVVQNGDRRGVLVLQNKASVLREKDILQQEDATSPARRIYFPVMMMYLDEAGAATYFEEFASRLAEFMEAISSADVLADCVVVSKHVLAREYYKALMACRQLIDYESTRIAPMSLKAYQNVAQQAEDPRSIEYRLFAEVTRALMSASTLEASDIGGRMTALDWNRRLWSVLATDCAQESNALPPPVRANVISLGLWVNRHTSAVMAGGESFEPLIEVNRTMMQGLAPPPPSPDARAA